MNSITDVWKNVLDHMAVQLSEITIKTWFDEVEVVTMEDSAFVLHCNNTFKKGIIESRYMRHIKDALREIFSADFEIKLLDDEQLSNYHGVPKATSSGLNESDTFTFETYVVGPQNKLAYAAARAVAEKPAENYNPLFIYGNSGLGKTHLLYAIAHQLKKRDENARVVYIKGDDFTNELVASIREGKNAEFREKYREATLLLVDDIQFIAGKQQTQEEFFHTFNTLYEAGKQIVLTSDRPPCEMTQLEDRLRTRFEWGLMVDVAPPDFETRLAIIKNKSALLGVDLSDSIAENIAENVTANVRQIEGTLNKILAYRDLLDDTMDQDTLNRAISDMLKTESEYVPTPTVIISYVCKYFNVSEEHLRGQSRGRDIMMPRQIAMYLIRRMNPNLALTDIGKQFGGRDHTTVLHSLNKVESEMRSNPNFAEMVKEVTTNINAKR
ncbi:MAG: chromosomal replication initiator protein DnaA [Clostridiales bacterium]|nr:chromosomal replication initiator protein DnaA [Candidatus Cacconaster stercorequi]